MLGCYVVVRVLLLDGSVFCVVVRVFVVVMVLGVVVRVLCGVVWGVTACVVVSVVSGC